MPLLTHSVPLASGVGDSKKVNANKKKKTFFEYIMAKRRDNLKKKKTFLMVCPFDELLHILWGDGLAVRDLKGG